MAYIKPLNVKSVLNNLNLVFKSNDINKLNKPAYNVLHNMNGFIAHYNIQGFKEHYADVKDLINDIKSSTDYTDPDRLIKDPWFGSQYGAEYPQSKSTIYNGLSLLINNL